jgi:hypothetical protein
MSRFFDAVKAGVRGAMDAMGPGRFQAAGKVVACSHCGGERFDRREARFGEMGRPDWLEASGVALVCTGCGLVQWFAREPERVSS